MRTDLVYELVDMRAPSAQHYPFPALGLLQHEGAGVTLHFPNGHGFRVELPDDDASSRFEEHDGGSITLHREDGDVVLVPLAVERYEQWLWPFLGSKAPQRFDNEAALHRYWRAWILEREVGA